MPTVSPITIQAFDAYLRCRTKYYLLDRQTVPLSSSFIDANYRVNAKYKAASVPQIWLVSGCKIIDFEEIEVNKSTDKTSILVDCKHSYYLPGIFSPISRTKDPFDDQSGVVARISQTLEIVHVFQTANFR